MDQYPKMSETKVQKYERIAKALRAHGIDEARVQAYVEYHQRGRFERADNIIHKKTCAARRRRDGLPCLSAPNPPYKFCRFHGGVSKRGKMSPEGRERCREAGRRGGTKTQMQNRQRKTAAIFDDPI